MGLLFVTILTGRIAGVVNYLCFCLHPFILTSLISIARFLHIPGFRVTKTRGRRGSRSPLESDLLDHLMMPAMKMMKRTSYEDQNVGPTLKSLAWTLAAISIVIVSMRFYVRIFIVRRVRWDDWTMLLSLVRPPAVAL